MFRTDLFDAAAYRTRPESHAELLNNGFARFTVPYIPQAPGVIAGGRGMTEVALPLSGLRRSKF